MRTQQLSITFPRKKQVLKEELLRMKEEENLNLSSYMVKLIENGVQVYHDKIKTFTFEYYNHSLLHPILFYRK